MKETLIAILILAPTFCLADSVNEKVLQCNLESVLDPAGLAPKALTVVVNLVDAKQTVINRVQVQDAQNSTIANYLGMAQILKWNDFQVAISMDFKHIYIKDISKYSCL